MRHLLAAVILVLDATAPVRAFGVDAVVSLDEVLAGMMSQKRCQENALKQYLALRHFKAANPRFTMEASLEVETQFRRPSTLESKVLRQSGSALIQNRVFRKILEAEGATSRREEKLNVDITPANYEFSLVGIESCEGRRTYRLEVSPKRKSQYLIKGSVWVDAADYGIVRIAGSPSVRPSFWTLRTQVERTYQKLNGVWLPSRTSAVSDVLVAGRSTLSIEYSYLDVDADSDGCTGLQ
jgi:hypothetical protein